MPKLITLPLDNAGVAGLNLQARSTVLGPEWATVMDNLVIDEQGRMAMRKGTQAVTDTGAASSLQTVFSSTTAAGAHHVYAADDGGALYNNASTVTVLTDRSGAATVASDGHYKFQNFNGKVVAFHDSGSFLVQATPTGNFADIVMALHTPNAANDVLAAFGRLWILSDGDLYWSDLLDETTWRTSGVATDAGYLNLNTVWPGGADVGVALAEFNGNLVIFGKQSIVIYADPVDPNATTFKKVEAIEGTGCLARDTVKPIGRDLIFVSDAGVKTLGRVIQEKSAPLNDSLPQARDYMASAVAGAPTAAKGAYAEQEGLYIITTPAQSFAVNVKNQLPNGAFRITLWDTFAGCADDGTGKLLLGSGTKVYNYLGSTDTADSSGDSGTALAGEYQSGWMDFSTVLPEAAPLEKILKRMLLSVYGGSEVQATFKWAVDYADTFNSAVASVPASIPVAEYGVAKFGVDHYRTSFNITRLSKPTSNTGRVVKVGLALTNVTTDTAVNRMDLFAKVGKTRII